MGNHQSLPTQNETKQKTGSLFSQPPPRNTKETKESLFWNAYKAIEALPERYTNELAQTVCGLIEEKDFVAIHPHIAELINVLELQERINPSPKELARLIEKKDFLLRTKKLTRLIEEKDFSAIYPLFLQLVLQLQKESNPSLLRNGDPPPFNERFCDNYIGCDDELADQDNCDCATNFNEQCIPANRLFARIKADDPTQYWCYDVKELHKIWRNQPNLDPYSNLPFSKEHKREIDNIYQDSLSVEEKIAMWKEKMEAVYYGLLTALLLLYTAYLIDIYTWWGSCEYKPYELFFLPTWLTDPFYTNGQWECAEFPEFWPFAYLISIWPFNLL